MLIHHEKFRIRANETGPNLKLTLPAIANFLQEAAWSHSVQLNVSVYDLLKRGLTWALGRLVVEVDEYLRHDDVMTVITWPSGYDRQYIFRDYHFQDQTGAHIGKAKSIWVILDLKTRKSIPAPDFITKLAVQNKIPIVPFNGEKIPGHENYRHEKHFTAGWHDIDLNNHVNNLSYIRWVIESTPMEILKSRELSALDLVFRSETFYGDDIGAFSTAADGLSPVLLHKLAHADSGKEVALAKTWWR